MDYKGKNIDKSKNTSEIVSKPFRYDTMGVSLETGCNIFLREKKKRQ